MDYDHPAYTRESVAAQSRLPGLNTAVTAFAGAYHGWGFHEDGCKAGVAAALALHGLLRPGGRLLIQQMSRGGNHPGGGPFIESYVAARHAMRPVGGDRRAARGRRS